MPEIIVDITEDGKLLVEGNGFDGPTCDEYLNAIESALGIEEGKRLKPEYYAATQKQREKVRGT